MRPRTLAWALVAVPTSGWLYWQLAVWIIGIR